MRVVSSLLVCSIASLGLCLPACGGDAELPDAAAALDAASIDATSAHDAGPDAPSEADVGRVPDAEPFDTGAADDGGVIDDAFTADTSAVDASMPDAHTPPDAAETDAAVVRTSVTPEYCPSRVTPAGAYRGTLSGSLNDIGSACGLSAPGRDGALRVMLAPGQTLSVTYRHAGDGVVYLLERCPVVASCVASADDTSVGAETLRHTHTGVAAAPYYLVLDSTSLSGSQTFELDVAITP